MRRIAVLALPLLFLIGSALPSDAQVVTIGLKGGPTFASVAVSGATFPEIGRRTGKVIGASVEIGSSSVGIRPELLLVQKGFEVASGAIDARFNVDYIEIPLLLVARFGSGSLRPAVYGGPSLGFESGCTITGNFEATGDCDAPDIDLQRDSNDWGAAFGAELGLTLGGVVLVVDGRYTLGLNNLDQSIGDEERKNRVFSLTGGVQIPIG